jgi:hypothetical protein
MLFLWVRKRAIRSSVIVHLPTGVVAITSLKNRGSAPAHYAQDHLSALATTSVAAIILFDCKVSSVV